MRKEKSYITAHVKCKV